ncbi:ABC-type transport auxiliary lipoprotein family protein [Campylobacter coli]|uniref:ABC-type transport auxiliary lipoprotein family protein n=1 Tax=Campylobacter coli TaxID=195 RepID=UPI0005B3EBA9|nr:ABC-type transport auxiliary lipoprotein family protein [Campylobacter coli]
MKKFIPIAILVFIFNACSVPTSTLDKTQSFILKNDEIPLQADFIKSDKILKIQNASLPLYLHSRSIVYIQKGVSGTYAHHFWADLPNNLYQSLLLSKFEQSQIFKALLSQGSSVRSDYILESRIDSFEQVVDENENYVSISISINFIDAKESKIIVHRLFSIKERVKKIDIFDVYQSFEKALNSLGNEIVLWINATLDEK